MDFIQLKDQRAACFEPIGTLSGYRWNNGFGYYVDIKDASTNFFFDGLGKGVYVLEYSYRISRAECMKPDWQPSKVHMHPNMFLTPLR